MLSINNVLNHLALISVPRFYLGKSSRLLSDLVEFSGTSRLVFDVWCC